MKRPIIAAALLTGIIVAPALAASSTSETFEMEVEINLAAFDDARTIAKEYDRLEDQIADTCKAKNAKFNAIRRLIAVKKCVNTTMDNTVLQIDHAELTRIHKERRLG